MMLTICVHLNVIKLYFYTLILCNKCLKDSNLYFTNGHLFINKKYIMRILENIIIFQYFKNVLINLGKLISMLTYTRVSKKTRFVKYLLMNREHSSFDE